MPPKISFTCRECSRAFLTKMKFVEHMKHTSCGEAYTCTNCRKIFMNPSLKLNHEKNRICDKNLEDRYDCETCGKSFETSTLKKYHTQKGQCFKPDDLTCQMCSIEFSSKIEFKLHILNKECAMLRENNMIQKNPTGHYFSSVDIPPFWESLNYSKLKNYFSIGRKIDSLMTNVICLDSNFFEYMAENINSGLNYPFLIICLNNETDENVYILEKSGFNITNKIVFLEKLVYVYATMIESFFENCDTKSQLSQIPKNFMNVFEDYKKEFDVNTLNNIFTNNKIILNNATWYLDLSESIVNNDFLKRPIKDMVCDSHPKHHPY